VSRVPYLNIDGKGHDKDSDHDVGECEGHDEVVGDSVQSAFHVNADAYERVAEQRQRRKHQQTQSPVLQPETN